MPHKRGKRRNVRAGCKMCKPWKVNGVRTERPEGEKFGDHRKRVAAAVAIAIALSGCATTRFVTVPCIAKDQVLPSEPPKIHDKLTGDADKDIRPIAGSNVRLRSWGEGLLGILEGCRGS